MSAPPLSAMTGNTVVSPCGLSLYCFHLRIDNGTFFIVKPTTPVQPLSLLLGTISHRIMSRVYSLSHRAIGRCGNLFRAKTPAGHISFWGREAATVGDTLREPRQKPIRLIRECALQMRVILVNMRIYLSQHGAV